MRLAVFVDQIFWYDGEVYSTDEAYVLFFKGFLGAFDEVVLIGRLSPETDRKPYVLDDPALRLSPMPYYERVADIWHSGAALRKPIADKARSEGPSWDVLLVCGPHPLGQYLAQQCIKLNVPVALVVRQNLVPQVAFATRGLRRMLGVAYALWLEWQFRRLARGRTVLAVGQEMTDAYARHTPRAHNHFACLIRDEQLARFGTLARSVEPGRLLCVGRLSAEKGHRYLFAALHRLETGGIACHLDIVGSGALEAELREQVRRLGLEQNVTFHGYVAYGPELFALYQRAAALVVPSLEGEGFPQVINEAMCVGLPVIASCVGGITSFLRHEETALLTKPGNVAALGEAIRRLLADEALAQRLAMAGRQLMQDNTLEANCDRIIQVLRNEVLA